MGAKYRYALNNAGTVVDILTLSLSQREAGAPYKCLGCGTALIPVLGQKRVKHFRHEHEQECSNETYLHKLAKQVFANTYRQALSQGTPFRLTRPVDGVCTHFEEKLGFRCGRQVEETHDLTRHFKRVDIEAQVGEFRADVLLSSSNGQEVILIEFFVSHSCEPQKIASGKRIVEIRIRDEADIQYLTSPVIVVGRDTVAYNFAYREVVDDICGGDCSRRVHIFVVTPNQKSAVLKVPASEMERKWNKPQFARHVEFLGYHDIPRKEAADLYRRKVREAYFAGIPIRNCYICKYQGIGRTAAIFCKVDKEDYASEQALTCEAYRPRPSLEACEASDVANKEYLEARERQRHEERMRQAQQAATEPKLPAKDQGEAFEDRMRSFLNPWTFWSKDKEGQEVPSEPAQLLTCRICGKETDDYWYRSGNECECRECYRAGRTK